MTENRKDIHSRQEADQWISVNKTSVKPRDFVAASVIPTRIDNCKDFAKDFFLPTFVNHALKIDNLVRKIIVSILAIAWDLITIPFRLIALPVLLLDDKSPYMPVEELIKESPHFAEAKRNGVVRLVAHVLETRVTETLGKSHPDITDARKDLPFRAESDSHNVSCEVYLKALPRGQREYLSDSTWRAFQRSFGAGGSWKQYNGLTHPTQKGEPVSVNR